MNFSSATFVNRAPYCRAWDSLPPIGRGTIARLRVGTFDESEERRCDPAPCFRPLIRTMPPLNLDLYMVPEDYFDGFGGSSCRQAAPTSGCARCGAHQISFGTSSPDFQLWPPPVPARPSGHADMASDRDVPEWTRS